MRSHSYSRGDERDVSPFAGRTRIAAKRDRKVLFVPSRQVICLNADSGSSYARSSTEIGCRFAVRFIRIGTRPRLERLLGGFSGASPGRHTLVVAWTDRAYVTPSAVMPSRNDVVFPYAASATTTPCGIPAETASLICCSAICGFVKNWASLGTPQALRRSACSSSNHESGM